MQHRSWRRIAAAIASLAGGLALGATPDFGGIWLPVESLSTPWPEPLPLTDAARTRFGAFDPDRDEPTGFCMPLGTPRNTLAGTSPMEVLQTADRVYFVFQPNLLNAETRRVYLNLPAKPADPERLPTWLGTSRGQFEDDVLVVDTTEMEPQAILHGSGLAHSGQLRLRERWHLGSDAKRGRILINDLVLDDPASFRAPVRLRRVFAHAADAQFAEGQCSEQLWIDQLWRHRLMEHAGARKAAASATEGPK